MPLKLFEIYNGFGTNLLSTPPIIEARNGRHAVELFLKSIGIKYTSIKASAGNDVQIKTTPFRYGSDGLRYSVGNTTWWEVR